MTSYRSPLRPDANAGRVAAGHRRRDRDRPRDRARARRAAARAWLSAGGARSRSHACAGEIEAAGGECLAVAGDLREPDAAARVVDASLERFGALDVLVNNAGGQFTAPAEEISDGGWRAVARRHRRRRLEPHARRSATRAMIPGGGGLIVFVGFSPLRGIPGFAHASAGARRGRRTSPAGWRWSGAATGSAASASRRARSSTEGLDGYDRGGGRGLGSAACRSAGSAGRRRSRR